MTRWRTILAIACGVFFYAETYAQLAPPGVHPPQNAAGVPDALPSDVMAKMQQLGQMLQQNINSMNPESGQLLDDINASMKNSPNADNLPDLLGGLTGQAQ